MEQELEASFCSTDPVIARRFAEVTFFGDNRDDLPRVPVPSLILQCAEDLIAPVEVGHYLHRHLPDSTLRLLEATGHCPHMSHPEETIQAMKEYLNPLAAAGQRINRMDSLLDTAPCGFLSFADDGKILAVNATLLGWLGYAARCLRGQSVETLLPVASRIFYQTHFFPLLKISRSGGGGVSCPANGRRAANCRCLSTPSGGRSRERRVNECIFMVVRQRSRYEDEILACQANGGRGATMALDHLQSIGDAVIATDAQGRVVFINPVAEELTGWQQAEALGRPLDEIFVILNEETRLPVESPVTRVLREKHVVGLANHTLLVARDGAYRPIDDSGAPIRNNAGRDPWSRSGFRDFTERRQTEQALREHQIQIEALNQHLQRAMTETHHRVKNNLQVISALVEMQIGTGMESVPISELVRLSQHIRGLAVIHDLLTHQTKHGGEAENLSVRDTLDKLFPLLQGMSS